MLWTDGPFILEADLNTLDAEVTAITAAEDLDLTGIIKRGTEHASRKLMSYLQAWTGYLSGTGGLSANHLAAVFNTGSGPVNRQRVLLENIVISGRTADEWSPLKTWAAYVVLQIFMQAAMNRGQEDRYKVKMGQYEKMVKSVFTDVQYAGVPVVRSPLICPASLTFNSGSWTASAVAGAGTAADDYSVTVTYLDSTQTANNESAPSTLQTVELATSFVLKADITALVPPTGVADPTNASRAIISPLKATHWNVYVGLVGGTLYKQNSSPTAIATKTYTLAGNPTTTGAAMGMGQYAEQHISVQDMVFRG